MALGSVIGSPLARVIGAGTSSDLRASDSDNRTGAPSNLRSPLAAWVIAVGYVELQTVGLVVLAILYREWFFNRAEGGQSLLQSR